MPQQQRLHPTFSHEPLTSSEHQVGSDHQLLLFPTPSAQEAPSSLTSPPNDRSALRNESSIAATAAMLVAPTLAVESLRLAPHPTAPRAARNFVTRTLLDWQLSRVIPFACLVVSELVASSSVNAGTDIDVSLGWDRGDLRIAVRDAGPALQGQRPVLDLHGRGRTIVAGLSRAFGVVPTGVGGGKVVWAVLDAPRTSPVPGRHATERRLRRASGPHVFAT